MKEYRKRYPEKYKEYYLNYNKENKEKITEYKKKNKEKITEYNKEYYNYRKITKYRNIIIKIEYIEITLYF